MFFLMRESSQMILRSGRFLNLHQHLLLLFFILRLFVSTAETYIRMCRYMFFSTYKHKEIRAELSKDEEMKKVRNLLFVLGKTPTAERKGFDNFFCYFRLQMQQIIVSMLTIIISILSLSYLSTPKYDRSIRPR